MRRPKTWSESQENKDALTRIVRERWDNIVRGARAIGIDPGQKPKRPKSP